jgi:uncharacterized phiE125 gp8 family phage protein
MTLRLVAGPTAELVSIAEAREWAKLSDSEPDWIISMLIAAARERAEHLCGRSFSTKTYDLVLDAFPEVELDLETSPVESITWVRYLDDAGAEQTMDPSTYVLDPYGDPCFLLPAAGYVWPSTIDSVNAVRIRFVEGWSSNPIGNINSLRQFIAVTLATDMEFRQSITTGADARSLPGRHHDALLDPLRVYGV